ncbi:MAG: N-acetylmuramoyl-L-alanine amidase [Lachnospiraceae bacterium]|nr:N-acetylmuramoyl-L-alanine amidase [Lachnospiraceae bacterium]
MHKKHIFSGILLCVAFLILCMNASAAPRIQKTKDPIILVLDPGHGGENNGTEEGAYLEKDMNLLTAQVMAEELRKYDGIKVYLTREDDTDLSLKDRAKVAADLNADFLVSIHYNASESHALFGAEAWISLIPEYHAQGYQLATCFLREYRDMGVFIRGVKTRRHSKGNDYYGVIRESVTLGVPALIVEHCHVDHPLDQEFCDSEEDWKLFGKADALAVAKYFGLKSKSLGEDHTEDAQDLPEVTKDQLVPRAMQDLTEPLYCHITLIDAKYEEDLVSVYLTGEDPDSNLIYYSVSFDGGETFGSGIPLPGGDILTGEMPDSFRIDIEVPDKATPRLALRVYNPYDLDCISNVLTFDQKFQKPVPTPEATKEIREVQVDPEPEAPSPEADKKAKLFKVIGIACIATGVLLFIIILFTLLLPRKKKED